MSVFTASGELIAIVTVSAVIVVGIAISVVILVIVITTVISFNRRIKRRLISPPPTVTKVTNDNHEVSQFVQEKTDFFLY